MKITILKAMDEEGYRQGCTILIDDEKFLRFFDVTEDNNLARNFNDIYQIPALISNIVAAAADEDVVSVEEKTVTWDEFWDRC